MEYTKENLGKRDPQYGGVLTDVSTLPVGTQFFVRNGYWTGRIVEKDGEICLYVVEAKEIHRIQEQAKRNGYILSISDIEMPGITSYVLKIDILLGNRNHANISINANLDEGLTDEDIRASVNRLVEAFIQETFIPGVVKEWNITNFYRTATNNT